MKANLLQKNKNILRFPVIWKINNPQHHQSALLLKTQTQNPRFLTHPTSPKLSKHRFETNNFYFGFKIVFWKQIKLTEVSLQRKETRKYHKDYRALAYCRFHGYDDETNRFRDLICRTVNG